MTPLTRTKRAVRQPIDTSSRQSSDGVTDSFEHATNLTITPLMNGDPHEVGSNQRDIRRSGHAIVELHSVT